MSEKINKEMIDKLVEMWFNQFRSTPREWFDELVALTEQVPVKTKELVTAKTLEDFRRVSADLMDIQEKMGAVQNKIDQHAVDRLLEMRRKHIGG